MQTSKPEYILLLTACIAPIVSNVKRNNPSDRLKDYLESLLYWLELDDKHIKGIVFAENSGYSMNELVELSKMKNKFNRKIEFIQYKELDSNDSVHYGYYEYKLLDYCFGKSNLITDDTFVVKITGRLYFENLPKLIEYHHRYNFQFLSDSRNYCIPGVKSNYSILTTLFICHSEFYRIYLMNRRELMYFKEFYYLENTFFHLVMPFADNTKVKVRFPFNMEPTGIGGHSNKNYGSTGFKLKSFFRAIFRVLLPNFHI